MKRLFILFIFILSLTLVPFVYSQTTQQTDYQYQLDQYRKNYSQYQILLKDYKDESSLNNEQKAITSAKETLRSRELALAHYYWWQSEIVQSTKVDLPVVKQAISDYNDIGQYHYQQLGSIDKIVTRSDLTSYTKKNRKDVDKQQLAITRNQTAAKIAKIIASQLDIKRAFDAIVPQLESTKVTNPSIQNGLDQVNEYSIQVNDLLNSLSESTIKLDLETKRSSQFYEDSTDVLNQVHSLQLKLINLIIELDTAYVAR